jgi:septal ring factor EnvC (AmiA/AmiB activator)
MNKFCGVLLFFLGTNFFGFAEESKKASTQPQEMRELCRQAQDLEKKINKLRIEIGAFSQKEQVSTPLIRNIYEILTRCFTILFDIQRFSNLLVLSQIDNKNDFVKCSIIIKNFAPYFKSVSSQLEKAGAEMSRLKISKQQSQSELEAKVSECGSIYQRIETNADQLISAREENVIQNDVIYHLATKSESLDELDAELEAENAVGVLKDTVISTQLEITHPVVGKIVGEFGDRGTNDEMLQYIAFETSPHAIVTSPVKGLVVFSGKFLNYGNILIISNGEYRVFLYGMDSVFASIGDVLEIGDYVGRMRAEGEANHVIKMELRKSGEPLDPRSWMLESAEKKERENEKKHENVVIL